MPPRNGKTRGVADREFALRRRVCDSRIASGLRALSWQRNRSAPSTQVMPCRLRDRRPRTARGGKAIAAVTQASRPRSWQRKPALDDDAPLRVLARLRISGDQQAPGRQPLYRTKRRSLGRRDRRLVSPSARPVRVRHRGRRTPRACKNVASTRWPFWRISGFGADSRRAPLLAECGTPEPACAIAAIRRQVRLQLALLVLAGRREFS